MYTIFIFAENKTMKTSTKILFVIFIAVTIPSLVLGNSILAGITATENGFIFNFDVKGIIAIILTVFSIVLGSILFTRFLSSLRLEHALFFSSLPLIVIYGGIMFLIADLSNINSNFAKSVRSLLNLSTDNAYNTILWAVLVTIIFIVLLSINYFLMCKPMNKLERIVSRLGDGKVKEEKLQIGGGKQFKNIEHGLNKINNNYMEKDRTLRTVDLKSQRDISKRLLRFIGKNDLLELERGRQIKKHSTIMSIRLDSSDNSLTGDYNRLNSLINGLSPVVRRYGGFMLNYNGSGVVCIFTRSEDAIDCAVAVCRNIRLKNKANNGEYKVRLSIFSGEPSLALTGQDKKQLLVVSDEVKLLEKMSRIGDFIDAKIVFSKSCIDDLPLRYKFAYRYIGNLNTYDNSDILLFEDLDVYSKEKSSKLIKNKGLFERGVICYNNGDYQKALDYFKENLRIYSDDKAGYVYYNNAKEKLSQDGNN